MRVLFLVNRASGSYDDALVRRCVEAVEGIGAEVKVVYPEGAGEFRNALREAVGVYDVVVVGGGDGTVGLAADTLRGEPQPVALLPLGRGNTFYKSVYGDGEPCSILRAALRGGVVRPVDVGYVVELDRFFVLGVSMGFIPEVLRASGRYRVLGGRTAYALAALERIFVGVASSECVVRAGGTNVYVGEATLLAVGNTRFRAGRFKLFPEAEVDDGVVDYLVVPRLSRLGALRLFRAALRGAHTGFEGVVYGRSAGVRFECGRLLCEVDGDIVGAVSSVTVEARPGMLSIVAPAGSD